MRNIILVTVLITIVSCNAKSTSEKETKTTDTAAVTPPVTTDTIPSTNPPTSGKIDIESFGPIKIGMPYKELVAAIGHPGTKGEAVEWAADGLVHQDWPYKSEGIVLNVSFEKDQLLQTGKVFSITATAPCVYKTRAGMGIGSTYAEIQEAYKRDIDAEATDKTQITVGSIYGGIIFSFKNDKAEKIFLGAQAE